MEYLIDNLSWKGYFLFSTVVAIYVYIQLSYYAIYGGIFVVMDIVEEFITKKEYKKTLRKKLKKQLKKTKIRTITRFERFKIYSFFWIYSRIYTIGTLTGFLFLSTILLLFPIYTMKFIEWFIFVDYTHEKWIYILGTYISWFLTIPRLALLLVIIMGPIKMIQAFVKEPYFIDVLKEIRMWFILMLVSFTLFNILEVLIYVGWGDIQTPLYKYYIHWLNLG